MVKYSDFRFFSIRPHIGRLSGRSTPHDRHLVVKNGNLDFTVNNVNFRFLPLELILADQLAN